MCEGRWCSERRGERGGGGGCEGVQEGRDERRRAASFFSPSSKPFSVCVLFISLSFSISFALLSLFLLLSTAQSIFLSFPVCLSFSLPLFCHTNVLSFYLSLLPCFSPSFFRLSHQQRLCCPDETTLLSQLFTVRKPGSLSGRQSAVLKEEATVAPSNPGGPSL